MGYLWMRYHSIEIEGITTKINNANDMILKITDVKNYTRQESEKKIRALCEEILSKYYDTNKITEGGEITNKYNRSKYLFNVEINDSHILRVDYDASLIVQNFQGNIIVHKDHPPYLYNQNLCILLEPKDCLSMYQPLFFRDNDLGKFITFIQKKYTNNYNTNMLNELKTFNLCVQDIKKSLRDRSNKISISDLPLPQKWRKMQNIDSSNKLSVKC